VGEYVAADLPSHYKRPWQPQPAARQGRFA